MRTLVFAFRSAVRVVVALVGTHEEPLPRSHPDEWIFAGTVLTVREPNVRESDVCTESADALCEPIDIASELIAAYEELIDAGEIDPS